MCPIKSNFYGILVIFVFLSFVVQQLTVHVPLLVTVTPSPEVPTATPPLPTSASAALHFLERLEVQHALE